jgi:hypothetical protein
VGWLQKQDGDFEGEKNHLPLPGFELWTVQPIFDSLYQLHLPGSRCHFPVLILRAFIVRYQQSGMMCQYQTYGTENTMLVWYSCCFYHRYAATLSSSDESVIYLMPALIYAPYDQGIWVGRASCNSHFIPLGTEPKVFVTGWASELVWMFGKENKICLCL